MIELRAPGLRAGWLNGWLAALGTTVLVDGATVRWTDAGTPVAVLAARGEIDPVAAVAAALPSLDRLAELAIASHSRYVTPAAYEASVAHARARRDDFSLAASVTDLARSSDGKLLHSPFDPPAPKGETLWARLRRCRAELGSGGELVSRLRASFEGRGTRIAANGLGFDYTRITAAANPSEKLVDPVVELMAFYGLAYFPVRGSGGRVAQARGWIERRAGDRIERRFLWPTWPDPLDRWAIDALLGSFYYERGRGRHGGRAFEAVEFQWSGNDVTRGFASRAAR